MAIAEPGVAAERLTYEEYLAEGEINRRYDIVDGVRVYMGAPTLPHQEIAGNVFELLRGYQRASRRGRAVAAPFDVLIRRRPLRTRQPDVLFISYGRLREAGGPSIFGPLAVAPELVVEVLSEGETRRSRQQKIDDYCTIGVREAWIVSPQAETVEVLRLGPNGAETAAIYGCGQALRSEVLPDLTLPVADVFNVDWPDDEAESLAG